MSSLVPNTWGSFLSAMSPVIKGAVASKPKRVKPPVPEDAETLNKSRRRSVAMQAARSGRASTILSDPSQKLGG
jgi:hypothetical protein